MAGEHPTLDGVGSSTPTTVQLRTAMGLAYDTMTGHISREDSAFFHLMLPLTVTSEWSHVAFLQSWLPLPSPLPCTAGGLSKEGMGKLPTTAVAGT